MAAAPVRTASRPAPPPPGAPPCQRHPAAPAGWRCQACEAALCVECAEGRRVGSVELVACGLCGGAAPPILVHRDQVPLARRLSGAWRFLVTPGGIQSLVAISGVLALLAWMAHWTFVFLRVLPLALYFGVFWGTFFALLRGASRGDSDPELPEFVDLFRDGILPGLRGLVVMAVLWLPLLARARMKTDVFAWDPQFLFAPDMLADPVLWGMLLVGLLWLPMALILTATGQPLRSVFNPVGVFLRALRLGGDYLLAVGVLLVLVLVHALAHALGARLLAANVFVVSRWGAELLTCVAPFLGAHVLGLLLYVRGDALGYSAAGDSLRPVLGDARPVRQPPPLREALAPAPESSPEPTAEPTSATGAGRAAAEQVAALASAVDARDVAQALAVYAALRALPGVRVPPAHHLFVGQAAAVEGDFPLSIQALEAAADAAPDEPTAPRALVLLARVVGERMRDTARAEELYRYVVHRYPESEAARFARQRLPPSA